MRRVVVTGLGLVTPVGCGVEASWSNLLAGANGARRVEEFEVSDIASQIGCFVPRGATEDGKFNPDDWMEPKEQRNVDDFIIYALAAAEQALTADDFQLIPEFIEQPLPVGDQRIGLVLGTNPGIGARVSQGFTIQVFIGVEGQDTTTTVPDTVPPEDTTTTVAENEEDG